MDLSSCRTLAKCRSSDELVYYHAFKDVMLRICDLKDEESILWSEVLTDFDVQRITWNSDRLRIIFLLAMKLSAMHDTSRRTVELFLCQDSLVKVLNTFIPNMFPTVQSLDSTSYVALCQLTRLIPLSLSAQQRLISLCSRSLSDCVESEGENKVYDRRYLLVLDCSVSMLYNMCQVRLATYFVIPYNHLQTDDLAYGSVARACLVTLLNVLEDLAPHASVSSKSLLEWIRTISDKVIQLFIRGAQEVIY